MRKLLVAIDGSESARRALDHAVAIAGRGKDTELHLLNVHPDPVVYGEIQVYASLERMVELQRRDSEALLSSAAEQVRAAGVPHQLHVESGDIASVIARRADDLGCEGIIMGTRGMGAIANLMLGSVATKVVHLANVPVTLVK